jgi:hypothetical protein
VATADLVGLGAVDRALWAPQPLLEEPTRLGRGVKEEDAAGLYARVLPRMRHAARYEGAGPRPTDRDLVADLEGDLAAQHPGDFVAVAVQVERRLVPEGAVSSNSMMLSAVSPPLPSTNLSENLWEATIPIP